MKRSHTTTFNLAVVSWTLLTLTSCGSHSADGPPAVMLDEDVCAFCNMIISDERSATASLIQGPRGPEARLFDDFNCQVLFEQDNPDQRVIVRWSHDYGNATWLKTETAHFLSSDELRTPMASEIAAYERLGDAQRAQEELGGEVLSFEQVWRKLGGYSK